MPSESLILQWEIVSICNKQFDYNALSWNVFSGALESERLAQLKYLSKGGVTSDRIFHKASSRRCVVDINMPNLSGIEATKRIAESNPEVAVLTLTVYDREYLLYRVLQAGAPEYTLKGRLRSHMV